MKIEGRLVPPRGPKDKFWGVEIPLLAIHTQGRTRKEAYAMAKDAVECLVDYTFKVTVEPGEENSFLMSADDVQAFLAFILTRGRSMHGVSQADVAKKLKSKSVTGYARYEQGKTMPRLDQLEKLLKAINPKSEIVLKVG